MPKYDHKKIEKKWKKIWEKSGIYRTKVTSERPKYYVLDMFPYPSGAGLHVGHPKGYIATDVVARMKIMQGFNVLHPMGWDAFGLPAENYAIANKVHPAEATKKNVATFKKQLGLLGFTYDWDREVNTTDPKYYRWTQWAFLQMFKAGLAYESNEPINWCPTCQTGLANEDLEDGKCERCGTVVEKKPMRQWVLKITEYADRLLKDLDKLEKWPEPIKEMQRNWIGMSEGVNFKHRVKDLDIEFEVYDSVPQTFLAQTFVIIAPEHPLVEKLVKGTEREKEVMDFVAKIKRKKLNKKFDIETDIEGVFTGRYSENYVSTGRDLPIWVASFALMDYGTGIVGCSAHDERDFRFAKMYSLPLHPVLFSKDPMLAEQIRKQEIFYREPNGILKEPIEFKGREWAEVREDIIKYVVDKGWGRRAVHYKLRDWVFSRQRYWGEPIPLVHCKKCGVVTVPEEDLPVVLPNVKNYEPTGTGESPLANITKWVDTQCPQCGGPASRETNTMPQWAGSCWYYLRYIDPKNDKALVDKEKEKYWSPVDFYVGGAEHATRHLIYARFWHKFLYDIGAVNYDEPFTRLQNVGLILAEDGRKMSKRWGNVINPDEIVEKYGADAMRVYEMFMGPFDQPCAWSTQGLVGAKRFLERVWSLRGKANASLKSDNEKLTTILHQTIKKVSEDIENMRFNTAIAQMMTLVNEFNKKEKISAADYLVFVKLLSPFAPHLGDELWADLGGVGSILMAPWPKFDHELVQDSEITLAVQVNGKLRDTLSVSSDIDENTVRKLALESEKVQKWLSGRAPEKVIYVKGKLISIVV